MLWCKGKEKKKGKLGRPEMNLSMNQEVKVFVVFAKIEDCVLVARKYHRGHLHEAAIVVHPPVEFLSQLFHLQQVSEGRVATTWNL